METQEDLALRRPAEEIEAKTASFAAPHAWLGCQTIPALFQRQCRHYGGRTAHREKELGIWRSFSWSDYYEHAQWIALALDELGLARGEAVAILSEDRKEWFYFDMATSCAGGMPCGVYTTDSAAQLAHLVNDSGASFLIVENDEQLDKFLAVRGQMPGLRKVVVLEREGLRDFADEQVLFLDDLYKIGRRRSQAEPGLFADMIAKARPDDIRMLIYTSGTTGRPKGAMITHANTLFQLNALTRIIDLREDDELLCFLPLCHILERLFSVELQLAAGTTVNFAESVETVFENLAEVSPHHFTAVPRLWEKIYSRLQIVRKEATAIGRWSFDHAISAGMRRAAFLLRGENPPFSTEAAFRFWDTLVLGNVRRMTGLDRVRRAATGAAPISPDLLVWFWAMGVPLFEGYGQTENTGVASLNYDGRHRIGTVGRALPGTQMRIGENGEIQLHGPHVFRGYWRDEKMTRAAFTDDGWLRTGDVGRIDADGFLTITGRIKDIIITAGGKNIAPAEIESALKLSPYIADAVVIGDRRPYLTCLIMIDQENVENYAQEHRIPFGDFASLCAAPEIRGLIGGEVEKVNQQFARVEQIKDFRLIDTLLTAEDEEMTPTMKLKRAMIERNYANLIETMYAQVA